MRMFDSVVIACDQWTLDGAVAIRGALDLFRLRGYLHFCVQKQNVLDLLAGKIPESEYVVLVCHGLGHPENVNAKPEEMCMGFHVVDQVDGQWHDIEFALTPGNIPDLVHLPGRTVISLGCGSGRDPFARAFLDSGCKAAYIAPVGLPNQDACALFTIAFFYHLLSGERAAGQACTDQEAVERASAADAVYHAGTRIFRHFA